MSATTKRLPCNTQAPTPKCATCPLAAVCAAKRAAVETPRIEQSKQPESKVGG